MSDEYNYLLNKVFNEDCLCTMSKIPDNFIDLIITSPPYDKLRKYNGYIFDFESIAKEIFRIVKQGGVVVWVVNDSTIKGSETGTSFKQALYFKEVGFKLHDTMIFAKNNFIPLTHNRYEQQFEYMFIFSKGKPKTFNPLLEPSKCFGKINTWGFYKGKDEKNYANRFRENQEKIPYKEYKYKSNIWYYSTGSKKSLSHSAAFPEKLVEDHILSWSNINDIVFDPMCGSGTVAFVAKKNKRNYIASEISAEYCKIIENRLNFTELF